MAAEISRPYTVPHPMHPALAASPGDRACAITSNSRLRELNSLREFRLRNSVPALAREPALRLRMAAR
ncbi:hypothetical protein ACFYWO_32445, partial [Streptomyces sp. NPDC002932]|uniref:hypothetical protein n=1 Tax=Streptomyces sp. NPDC002932 TaxID=3364672 RepID=UPI0036AA1A5E